MQITFDPLNLEESKIVSSILALSSSGATVGVDFGHADEPESDRPEALADAIAESTAEGQKRRRRTKAEMEAARAAEEAAAKGACAPTTDAPAGATIEDLLAPAHAEAAVLPTIDDVRAAIQDFTVKHGINAGVALLAEFGAQRVAGLAEGDYAAVVERCAA